MSKASKLAEEIAEELWCSGPIEGCPHVERGMPIKNSMDINEPRNQRAINEAAMLIDQKLSGVTGGIALISAHIDDILGGRTVGTAQSLELIKKAADELWETLKMEEEK